MRAYKSASLPTRAAANQAGGGGFPGSQTNNQVEQASIQGAKGATIDQGQLGKMDRGRKFPLLPFVTCFPLWR